MAWSLRHAFPGQAVSLVAEEDAVELRAPEGAGMLARITALVNEALAVEHPQVGWGAWVHAGMVNGLSQKGMAKSPGGCTNGVRLPCCPLAALLSCYGPARPAGPNSPAPPALPPAQAAPLTPGEVADLIDSGNSAGGGSGRHWVLDPIDGTRGFVGMRQYAVCLGMLEEGEVRRMMGGWV